LQVEKERLKEHQERRRLDERAQWRSELQLLASHAQKLGATGTVLARPTAEPFVTPETAKLRRKPGAKEGLRVNGKAFKHIRDGHHLIQFDFAEVCGVSVSTIQRIEAGGWRISKKGLQSMVQRLSQKYKKPIELIDILAASDSPQN
jgi:DNA-binding transcriptional regulator YiaG